MAPKRINSKNKNTEEDDNLLKMFRYKIEHVNRQLKDNARIELRKDRKLKYYISFIFIACLLNNAFVDQNLII